MSRFGTHESRPRGAISATNYVIGAACMGTRRYQTAYTGVLSSGRGVEWGEGGVAKGPVQKGCVEAAGGEIERC